MIRPSKPTVLAGWIGLLGLLALLSGGPLLLAGVDLLREPAEAWTALTDLTMWRRLGITLGMAGVALSIALVGGLLLAWLLVRTDLPLRGLLLALVPFPLFLPPLVHVLAWFGMMRLSGWEAVIVVYATCFMPLVVLLAARVLETVPRDLADLTLITGGRFWVFTEDLRQALPAGLMGCALALVFIVSDFAVADFLSAIGPSITTYGDSLYAHHLAWRSAGAVAAGLPGLVVCLLVLGWALRQRHRLGDPIDPQYAPADPFQLKWWRWGALAAATAVVGAGSVLPLGLLAWQTGGIGRFTQVALRAGDRIWFSLWTGAVAAVAMVCLALWAGILIRRRRSFWLDVLIFLPLATPALLLGVGLIRFWNRPVIDAIYTGSGVVLVVMVSRYLPLVYLPLSSAITRLEDSLFESAALDGAGPVRQGLSFVVPLTLPVIATAWCVGFCFSMRELDTLIMLRAGQHSLTHHLYASVIFADTTEVASLALLLAMLTYLPLVLLNCLCIRPGFRGWQGGGDAAWPGRPSPTAARRSMARG